MKRNTLRIAGAAALAAVTIGFAAPTALAAGEESRPAATTFTTGIDDPTDETPVTPQEAQEAAQALLNSDETEAKDLVASLDADEQADLQAVANGETPQELQANWGKIWKVLKKVGGFAKAVQGSYHDFQAWYKARPWYVKALIKGTTVGLNLYDIWSHFH